MTGPPSGPIFTAAQMRAVEAAKFTAERPPSFYMERAGKAVADLVWRIAAGRGILILAGPGNNGGDGYVAARHLQDFGANVRVVPVVGAKSEGARRAAGLWEGPTEPLSADTKAAPIIIDAIFGTGARGGLDPAWEAAAFRLFRKAERVIAIDLPSALNSDNPTSETQWRTDVTLALGALKPAHVLQPAASGCGTLLLDTLGLVDDDIAPDIPQFMTPPAILKPLAGDHKYSRGMVAVIAGAMPGAAALAVTAAARGEAGYAVLVSDDVTLNVPHAVVRRSRAQLSRLLGDKRLNAVAIGPGLGRDADARALLDQALASEKPLVIDGDALHLLDPATRFTRPVILTPHHGEFIALFGQIEGNKMDQARIAAERCNAVIVYKGADTVIAAPDGRMRVAPPGSPWLASAGTGDVLAGLCGASLARFPDLPFENAETAVWLHAEAGRLAGPGLIADDLIDHLPKAVQRAVS